MAISLTNLIALVNDELENKTYKGQAEVVADGVRNQWNISPHGYHILDDSDFSFLANGTERTETTEYYMDFSSGVCTYRETSTAHVPDVGVSLKWYYNYVIWDDAIVTEAINAAINCLFPAFYVESPGAAIATNGSTTEFECTDPLIEFVRSYDWSADGTTWTRKRSEFDLWRDGEYKVIQFFTAPSSGYIRLHTIARPAPLAAGEDLGDAGLPERAAFPIVSYACYYLLTQKTAPRARGDVAVSTQGIGTLSPRQMNDAANAFYLRYQMQVASVKMPPWSYR